LASQINASNSGFGGIVSTGDSSGVLQLQTTGTTAVTIDTSQNVGIGTSSPANTLNIVKDNTASRGQLSLQTVSASNYSQISFYDRTTFGGQLYQNYANANEVVLNNVLNSSMQFWTNNTERMRIDSSGNVLVGTTTNTSVGSATNNATFSKGLTVGTSVTLTGNSGSEGIVFSASNFRIWNASTVGVYLTSGNTSWTANSDERLKTNLKPIENALEKVSTLRTVTGRFKTDDENKSRSFLIAQDIQKVFPEAIDIQNDEQKTLGVQYTDIIPLLTAAIKEQQTIINDLKARIETLEAK